MDKYYSAAELANLFHKKPDTVRKMIAHGDFGETLNTGRQHLVSESQLKAYISAHTGQAHSDHAYVIRVKRANRVADYMARI